MEPLRPARHADAPGASTPRAQVVFLVAGEDKAEAMVRAFGDPPDPASPAAHVRPRGRRVCSSSRIAARRGAA